ncbi:hypothetical protein [Clostridium botulinum]|uniref:hypothetical protein n=1 Tax=Clostridium botulinum TaxID=1491 RepID=UPI001E3D59E1|nr:hypothetical protein [Clostridium botulinum]
MNCDKKNVKKNTEDISFSVFLYYDEHMFQKGVSQVLKYSNYYSDESRDYTLTRMTVTANFSEKWK